MFPLSNPSDKPHRLLFMWGAPLLAQADSYRTPPPTPINEHTGTDSRLVIIQVGSCARSSAQVE